MRYNPFTDFIFLGFLLGICISTGYDMIQTVLGYMTINKFLEYLIPSGILLILGLVVGFTIHQMAVFLIREKK